MVGVGASVIWRQTGTPVVSRQSGTAVPSAAAGRRGAEEVQEAPRPTLTIRDALEAVRQTEPADLSTVVHHLTRMFTSRRPPRDLALIVFGMFAGRLGVARQLRDKGLSDALHDVSAADTMTAALAYLEDLAGGLQEDLPL